VCGHVPEACPHRLFFYKEKEKKSEMKRKKKEEMCFCHHPKPGSTACFFLFCGGGARPSGLRHASP